MRALALALVLVAVLSSACGGSKGRPITTAVVATPTQFSPFDAWVQFPAGTTVLSRSPFSDTVKVQQMEVLLPGKQRDEAFALIDASFRGLGFRVFDTSAGGRPGVLTRRYSKGGDFVTVLVFADPDGSHVTMTLTKQ